MPHLMHLKESIVLHQIILRPFKYVVRLIHSKIKLDMIYDESKSLCISLQVQINLCFDPFSVTWHVSLD